MLIINESQNNFIQGMSHHFLGNPGSRGPAHLLFGKIKDSKEIPDAPMIGSTNMNNNNI